MQSNHQTGTAPGKLILCGEHAVVYGQKAIAFAVDLTTKATIRPRTGPTNVRRVEDSLVQEAAQMVLGPNWEVSLTSTIPIGRGMGSSAALAVALVKARHRDLTFDSLFQSALPVEKLFHGNPSGLDVAVSARGGVLLFQRPCQLQSLACPSWQVVVLDTQQQSSTAQMVRYVDSQRPRVDSIIDQIGDLVEEAAKTIGDPITLGEILNDNQRLLAKMGVSNHHLDELVRLARHCGAYGAKLSGAGGGGVVLALIEDPEPLLVQCNRRQVPAWVCRPWS
ncbi:MAG: mevalonate kinase [Proteobacteria bacterium]|nr:mevalonate kinase [Pseudomonadota bacterium]